MPEVGMSEAPHLVDFEDPTTIREFSCGTIDEPLASDPAAADVDLDALLDRTRRNLREARTLRLTAEVEYGATAGDRMYLRRVATAGAIFTLASLTLILLSTAVQSVHATPKLSLILLGQAFAGHPSLDTSMLHHPLTSTLRTTTGPGLGVVLATGTAALLASVALIGWPRRLDVRLAGAIGLVGGLLLLGLMEVLELRLWLSAPAPTALTFTTATIGAADFAALVVPFVGTATVLSLIIVRARMFALPTR